MTAHDDATLAAETALTEAAAGIDGATVQAVFEPVETSEGTTVNLWTLSLTVPDTSPLPEGEVADPAAPPRTKGASRQYVPTSPDDIPSAEALALIAQEMVNSLTVA